MPLNADVIESLPWQRALLAALEKLPGADDPGTRSSLLHGVAMALTRSATNAQTDLGGIVQQLVNADPDSLLILIDNALGRVRGGRLHAELTALRAQAAGALPLAPPPTPTGPSAADLVALRTVLIRLYSNPSSAGVVVHDAQLDLANITMTGPALAIWQSILTEAVNQDRLAELVAVARSAYARNPDLAAAAKALGLP